MPIRAVARPTRYRTLYVLSQFAVLAASLAALLLRRGRDPEQFARRVREVFERMGGLWIKTGQLLALRIDLFPVSLCRELSRLQSQALGFPDRVARQIVEEDLGGPLDLYFDVWEGAPIAAASIGQVHRARLRHEQVWVAVKVQKPHSAELFARDFTVVEWIVRIVGLLRIYPHMKWRDGLHELRQIMREELDFGFEAGSTRRMRKSLRRHGVHVPKVFSKYCTARILVLEFLDMVLMADYLRVGREDPERLQQWRVENNVKPRVVARRLIHSIQRQMLEDNLFHGDLHPGNIGLLRDSRVAVIDFGTTNFTEADYLRRFRALMRTLTTDEFAKAADLCLMLCASLPPIDLGHVHARLVRVLQTWAARTRVPDLPFHDKSMDTLTTQVMQVLLGYRCTMEWGWLRLHRASSTLDASLIDLYPDVDYRKVTGEFFAKAERRRLRRALSVMGARRTLHAAAEALQAPERTREYASMQAALIRRHVQVFQGVADSTGAAARAVLGVGRLVVLVQGALLAAVLVSGGGAAAASYWATQWLWGLADQSLDPRPLAAVLLFDIWLWFALTRVLRAIGNDRVALHRRAAAAA